MATEGSSEKTGNSYEFKDDYGANGGYDLKGSYKVTGEYEVKDGYKVKGDDYEDEEEEEDEDLRCGYFCWTPDCIQGCNTPRWLLSAICWFTFTQSFVVNGINPVNMGTLERRFDLSSSQVAWIPSSYDLTAGLFAIIFGFLGPFFHNGAMLTIGAYVLALGSFVMFLPHILAGTYDLGTAGSELCDLSGNYTECDEGDSSLSNYLYVFIAGNVLHGVGGSAVYTISPPFLNANVKTKVSALYIGWMLAFSALGPAFGFIVGGLLLTVYVDIGRVDMDDVTVEPGDPGWIGAWWVGYLYSAFAGLTVAIYMCCFPRELPIAKVNRADKKSEAYKGKTVEEGTKTWKATLLTLKNIFTNPVWWSCTIAGTVLSGTVTAFTAFLPKVMQFQFSLTPAEAAIWAGIVVIPGAAGGELLGGAVPKWLKLDLKGMLWQATLCALVCVCTAPIYLMRCEMQPIAGITVPYMNSSYALDDPDVTHECNENCSCTTLSYDPTCGVDDIEYFSPCHAGCLGQDEVDGNDVYYDCSCIAVEPNATLVAGFVEADSGMCPADCFWLWPFLCLFLIQMLAVFMANTTGQAVTIRCMSDSDRAFGFGIQCCIVRWCGNVPGPLIFGLIFDSACLVWQDKCGHQASCWIYDSDYLAQGLTVIVLVVACIALVTFALGAFFYKPPPESETEAGTDYVIDVKSQNEELPMSEQSKTPDDDVTTGFSAQYDNPGFLPDNVYETTREDDVTKM